MTHCSWLCLGSLVIILYYNTIIIDDIRRVHYLCFSLCLVEGAHRVHVQLVKVDAPNVARVDGTLMSRVHNSKSVRGRWLLLFDGLCFAGQVCHGELNDSVLSTTYIMVVCRLNQCIWYAPCRMLLRNFPRRYFHAGGGGTVSNSV